MNAQDIDDVFLYSHWRTRLKCKTTVAGVLLSEKAIGFPAVSIISFVMSRNFRFSTGTYYKFSKTSLQKAAGWITSMQKAVASTNFLKHRTLMWLSKPRCYQVGINQSVRIGENRVGFLGTYFVRGSRELTNCHLPAIGSQIYLMIQLQRKCGERIIRIGLHKGNYWTECRRS